MTLTVRPHLPAFGALFTLLIFTAPAYAGSEKARPAPAKKTATVAERVDLYSPRVRHSTVMYLRLRLLELREAGLDRARAAIERRLTLDELLAEPTAPQRTQDLRPGGSSTQPSAVGSAKGPGHRTVRP